MICILYLIFRGKVSSAFSGTFLLLWFACWFCLLCGTLGAFCLPLCFAYLFELLRLAKRWIVRLRILAEQKLHDFPQKCHDGGLSLSRVLSSATVASFLYALVQLFFQHGRRRLDYWTLLIRGAFHRGSHDTKFAQNSGIIILKKTLITFNLMI